jgi:prepilin-type N-terminal cleavage/methylation domain-containing protein
MNTDVGTTEAGFTLREILIALAVGAILIAIALPAYTSYVDKARNKAAIGDLLKIQSRPCKNSAGVVGTEIPAKIEIAGSPRNWFNRG